MCVSVVCVWDGGVCGVRLGVWCRCGGVCVVLVWSVFVVVFVRMVCV